MPPYSRASLLHLACAGAASASNFLYVSSYAGTVTTLSTSSIAAATGSSSGSGSGSGSAGARYPVLPTVSSTRECAANPSWLTLAPDGRVLYRLDEGFATPDRGTLTSFRPGSDGSLAVLGRVATAGGPVHGALYGVGGLAVAHYGPAPVLSTFDVGDPSTMRNLSTTRFSGEPGPKKEQTTPHPHEAVVDPTGRFIIVPDLGADLIRVFGIADGTLDLTELPSVRTKAGSGPRHVVFAVEGGHYRGDGGDGCSEEPGRDGSGGGKKTFMYLITELSSTIVGYEVGYDGDGGINLEYLFEIGVHGKDKPVSSEAAAAEIAVSPDHRFLLATSRRENNFKMPNFDPANSTEIDSDSLVSFSIDAATGRLTLVEDVPAGGRFPRSFAINAAGTLVAVGVQLDGRVVVFDRDPATGKLGGIVAASRLEDGVTSVVFDS